MNSTVPLPDYLVEYHRNASRILSRVHDSEAKRLALEEKLRISEPIGRRLEQREKLEEIENFFSRLGSEEKRSFETRESLLKNLTILERNFGELRDRAEDLIRTKKNENMSIVRSPYEFEGSPKRVELSVDSLFFLLDHLEKQIRQMTTRDRIYRDDQPTFSQQQSILKIAQNQDLRSIHDFDPNTISMIVFSQLTAFVRRMTKRGSFFDENFLSTANENIQVSQIFSTFDPNDSRIFQRLLDHWKLLLQLRVFDFENLTSKFGSIIFLDPRSNLFPKAKSFLRPLVEPKTVMTVSSSSSDADSSSESEEKLSISPGKSKYPPVTWPPSSSSNPKSLKTDFDEFFGES